MNRISNYWRKKYRQPSVKAVRWFAVLLAAIGVLLGGTQLGWNWWLTTGLLPLLGMCYLPVLRAIYATLLLLTYPIGWCVSTCVLLFVYIFVLTPMAVFRNRGFVAGWFPSEPETQASSMHE